MNLPEVIDLRITGTCNLRCLFCFGPRHELAHLPIDKLIEMVMKFTSHGVKNLVISGGEPLLVYELPLLLKAAKENGLKTVLSTNGVLLERRIDEVSPYLDWIGLPLNGISHQGINLMHKGHPHHANITLNLISLIRKRYPYIRLRLTTVVCALNKNEITDIAKAIKDNAPPDVWKIFQVMYSNYAEDNRHILELSDEEFEVIMQNVAKVCDTYGIRVTFSLRRERDGKYLFFEPNGDAVIISDNKEIVIGNFLSDLEGVVLSWNKYVNPERIKLNFNLSYPC